MDFQLQGFLNSVWNDKIWFISMISIFFKNDNLQNCEKICYVIDNNHFTENYQDLFNIAFNMNYIRIFNFLWNNKREYDNHNILISNFKVSKKSKVGKFYFDELYKENMIQATFLEHCYKKNIYNISHILTYLIKKDYKEYLFLCKEAYSILIKNSNEINTKKCIKLILLFDNNVSKYIFHSVNYNYFYKFP